MEELLDLPFQNRGILEPMSVSASANCVSASALEICIHTHFLVNYTEEQWIIHPPPLISHFHN